MDTACSSSFCAFHQAYVAIRNGLCDSAVVGGCNLCLHPYISVQFADIGVLNPEGFCRTFDRDGEYKFSLCIKRKDVSQLFLEKKIVLMSFVLCTANGYVRSEAVCVVFLQKAQDAKRIYATILNMKCMSDGFKDEGIMHPSGDMHRLLLENCYKECGVEISKLEFFEGHGTGTKVSFLAGQTKTPFSLEIH
jgi:fatty acid synthase